MSDCRIRFDDGDAYENFMGKWSRFAGDVFLDWLKPKHGVCWLDVGCGNGVFTELLVITGHDAEGRAVIARDEQIDGVPIPGLKELAFLWGADEPATYPNAGDNPAAPAPFPPVGGIRFVIATYSPESDVVAPEPLPGMHVEDGDESGMHRTDSTDFGVVLSGNGVLELDDGVEVFLSPGDVVVQNGTRHRWRVVGGCRPPWLLSSSEPTAVRLRPRRDEAGHYRCSRPRLRRRQPVLTVEERPCRTTSSTSPSPYFCAAMEFSLNS